MGINKNTLYVWDGILEVQDGSQRGVYDVVWHGTLFANEFSPDATKVQAPKRDAFKEFCDSDLQFRVTGQARPVDVVMDENKFKHYRIRLTDGPGWDLDGQKHHDIDHEVISSLQWQGSSDPRKSLVFATGGDSYGKFISVGWMRPGNRVTLARRYVSDNRAEWSSETLRQETLKIIYDDEEEECVMPPWQCNVFSAY